MPEETPATPPKDVVSPTGTPVIPSSWVKFILPVVAVAGSIAIAPTMGVDISFLPPLVPKISALVAFLGMTLGIAGPGVRK